MKIATKIVLSVALLSSFSFGGEQFAMSDADRAMYAEMLENNPADIMVESGSELLGEIGGDSAFAKYLGMSEDELPKYIAGFPRYVEKFDMVVGIDQVLQAMMFDAGKKPYKLKSKDMFNMLAYVKSLANDEAINIDVNANKQMKEAFALGQKTFDTKRGGRGLACLSCHSPDVIGSVLRTQPLPDLGAQNAGGTWPAYRMTKSSLRTLQRRFQGCMKNALLAVIPIGSPEMVALEVYITDKAKGKTIAIPGLKR
ncbi:sulfur oxidation c-type cytochrome SoxA [Candidatus Sulfurimonas marisnigri]|uniref:SoxAX cytochrome complex subunit A n=1 Tax=Candidatus Sulfurimonas marisnigri TaxID=2740405 RepID=A0A7S7M0M8_9BACT|nr:sulfur oxidation c-type cytochrome SoxA [Candidatus Sulfurimonas marisnigri]QOY54864.1 sulfur oxidation c-type cytochrome SoxA [Candidatus Sulfurimonas marisnigri]